LAIHAVPIGTVPLKIATLNWVFAKKLQLAPNVWPTVIVRPTTATCPAIVASLCTLVNHVPAMVIVLLETVILSLTLALPPPSVAIVILLEIVCLASVTMENANVHKLAKPVHATVIV